MATIFKLSDNLTDGFVLSDYSLQMPTHSYGDCFGATVSVAIFILGTIATCVHVYMRKKYRRELVGMQEQNAKMLDFLDGSQERGKYQRQESVDVEACQTSEIRTNLQG